MNENIYYISIQSTSLAHYLGKALILSSRFYKNRPSDIQSIENDYIILSKNSRFLNDSNCSIEVVLTDEEITYLKDTENSNIFLYPNPIPISRIKQVYFIDEIQKLRTIDNINKGVGFISERFIEVIEEDSINVNISNDYNNKYSSELESKIKTYNHVLGGLAFVKNTLDGEYTKNYFSILSHFNSSFNTYIGKKNRLAGYDGAFTHKGKVWDKLSPLIYENISEDDVKRYAKEEDITIEKSNGIFKYENINKKSITYKLAILNTYGEDSSKRKKTNDLIYDCKNGKITKEKQEGIALIYGINNGYLSFRNQYDNKIVKFKMDSRRDYYTIESVFQYVINDKKDNKKFEYIDEIFPDEELNISHSRKEESFDLEQFLKDILNYFQENQFSISPKELISKIINKFKNIFLEEISKKDIKISDMESKIKELDQNINSLKEEVETKNSKLGELNQKVTTTESELQEQKDIVNQVNQEIEKKANEIDNLNKSLQAKADSNKQLEQENQDLNENIDSLKEEVETKNSELGELNQKVTTTERELQEQKDIVTQVNQEIEKKANEINNLNKSLQAKADSNKQLEQENQDLNENIDSLKEEVETKNSKLGELNQKVTTTERELQEQKDIVTQLKDNIIQQASEIERLKTSVENKESKLKEQEGIVTQLNDNITQKDNKVTFDEEKERIIIEQDLYKLKVKDLKDLAHEKGLKFNSRIKKQELIELLKKEAHNGLF